MPDRRGATLLEDLPGEIIDMILVRLPSKDVGRCRAVSTSWRSATSTFEFMLEHHRRQPLLPIINGQGRPASFVVLGDAGARVSSQQLWPFLPGAKNHSKHAICASCDGYLIRYDISRSLYYIYNPVICKEALLPWPQVGKDISNQVIGFYRHHPTGEYRVLWVSSSKQFSKCSLYVFTVGSNESRHVTVTMPAGSSPSVEQELLKGLCTPQPVHHNGSLHWCSEYFARDIMGDGGDIIVFDTEAESFRSMRSPYQPSLRRKLFSMNGTLAFWGISTFSIPYIDIWVMQDYEAEIWAVKYRIDLLKVDASRQLYLSSKRKKKTPFDSTMQSFVDMVVLNKCELLIMFNNNHVLRCDIDGKFLGMVNIGKHQYCMKFTHHLLQESIIPIPSHEMQGEDEEPPFSTGMSECLGA